MNADLADGLGLGAVLVGLGFAIGFPLLALNLGGVCP